jgi:MSHA biogenesis protein MshO
MTVVSTFQRGFTLLETVIVIVITGVIFAALALFLRWPFQSYIDAANREQMTDAADTALRRMARDLHIALPNSIRQLQVGANTVCLELLPTKAGGRYRAQQTAAGQGTILDFTQPTGSFDMFGQFSALPGQTPVANDQVVVYNLGGASPGANAYAQNNTAAIASFIPDPNPAVPGETLITLNAPTLFPLASPSNRFQVIGSAALTAAVTYECLNCAGPNAQGNGTGQLLRISQYQMTPAPACPPVAGPATTTAVLANNVLNGTINYNPAVQRNGVVQIQLSLEQNGETVTMYHEVEVNNAP